MTIFNDHIPHPNFWTSQWQWYQPVHLFSMINIPMSLWGAPEVSKLLALRKAWSKLSDEVCASTLAASRRGSLFRAEVTFPRGCEPRIEFPDAPWCNMYLHDWAIFGVSMSVNIGKYSRTMAIHGASGWGICFGYDDMEVSWVMGLPPVIIHLNPCGIVPNRNHPANLGYPHSYGNPHISNAMCG